MMLHADYRGVFSWNLSLEKRIKDKQWFYSSLEYVDAYAY